MRVGIVGGGASGLYAALLLRQEGHSVTVFEATDRLGGRIFTHRFPATMPGEDPYFELGAMRLPCTPRHEMVFKLVRYLNFLATTRIYSNLCLLS